mmetsp:Transcript_28491/g.51519  ORF Transcript_28491/g.51519 Transcript_28491/m.51519 type:complete len:312 (-) Transcript_28491:236-1171(-)
MFDFGNLDDIDDNAATPEWLKWRGVAQWQRAPQESLAVLEEDREETFASPGYAEEDFVYEPIDMPKLPDDSFDPLALSSETPAAVDAMLASLNGQVIVNFASSAVEEFMLAKREREEYKAYIDSLHQQRLNYLESKKNPLHDVAGSTIGKKDIVNLERKSFAWREIRTVLPQTISPTAKDAYMAETVFSASPKLTRSLVPVATGAMVPTSMLVHMLLGLASQVRPEPAGRWGRNAQKHIAITDMFLPTGMVLDDASDVINKKREPPSLVHLVAMSVNKEYGEVDAKVLLQNIKLPSPSSYPSIKPRYQVKK